jgi:starch synthase
LASNGTGVANLEPGACEHCRIALMPPGLRVLFIAAEAEPYVKVGGLGDVAGSLPLYLRSIPVSTGDTAAPDVRLVLPLHPGIDRARYGIRPLLGFSLTRAGAEIQVRVSSATLDGMPVYFIDGGTISGAAAVYSHDPGVDAGKYTFFSLAALELPRLLDWQPNVLHVNDWHTAPACYAFLLRRRQGDHAGAFSVLTLHNLPFMGPDLDDELAAYGLPVPRTDLPAWASRRPLPLGLWAADAIVPVSPTYAREIQTGAFGCGLEGFLRGRAGSVHGILNGIDYRAYNPAQDPALASCFDDAEVTRRAPNKAALQARLGLAGESAVPLLAVVSRLDPQKGIDLLRPSLRMLREPAWQLVVLGAGSPRLERSMRRLQNDFPDRVRAEIRYDAALARQIYAGADILLMPSRYEPCGLSQMIALRYGCVPVVSPVGGLQDTVVDGETGFVAPRPTVGRLARTIDRALETFQKPQRWSTIQVAGMMRDFSWKASASEYVALYQRLLGQLDLV